MVTISCQLHCVNQMFHYTTQEVTSNYWQENEASPINYSNFTHLTDYYLQLSKTAY